MNNDKKIFKLPDGAIEIVRMRTGSALYGTQHHDSDVDIKSVFFDPNNINESPDIVLSTKEESKKRNVAGDIDYHAVNLHKFLEHISRGKMLFLEMLFAPESLTLFEPHPIWKDIKQKRHLLFGRYSSDFNGFPKKTMMEVGASKERIDLLEICSDWFLKQSKNNDKIYSIINEFQNFVKENVLYKYNDITASIGIFKKEDNYFLSICQSRINLNDNIKTAAQNYSKMAARYKQLLNNPSDRNLRKIAHTIRTYRQSYELLMNGYISLPRNDEEIKRLKAIKAGDKDLVNEAFSDILNSQSITSALQNISSLRDHADENAINSILNDARLTSVGPKLSL